MEPKAGMRIENKSMKQHFLEKKIWIICAYHIIKVAFQNIREMIKY